LHQDLTVHQHPYYEQNNKHHEYNQVNKRREYSKERLGKIKLVVFASAFNQINKYPQIKKKFTERISDGVQIKKKNGYGDRKRK
jgi:hypothetical protein